MEQFETLLGKENPILGSIRIRGFTEPSEIQWKAIPYVLEGRDVIAGASTGSGKTLAFAVGLVKNVKKDFGIQGLVLTPTRELAEQIVRELTHFASEKKLHVLAVYGGVSITNQMKQLRSAEIVVATPGRMLDHLSRRSINLNRVNTLVLDEADRMLDMGFIEDVEKIISNCPRNRQTLLFSATISPEVFHIAKKYLRDPVEISAEPHVDPTKLTQIYYDVDDSLKFSLLCHLLKNESAQKVIVFCNTRNNVDFVSYNLQGNGIEVMAIHGGFSQDKRNKIIERFHSKPSGILIATDVAARGLDIKDISHIYNYDSPPNKKEYIHRIGRTARAGSEGKVINIIASRDHENFQQIMDGELPIEHAETPYVEKVRIQVFGRPNRYQRGGRFSRERYSDSNQGRRPRYNTGGQTHFQGHNQRGRPQRRRSNSIGSKTFGRRYS